MLTVAFDAATRALGDGGGPRAHTLLGELCYVDPDHGPAEALPWFDRALAAAPDDGWARLYRAHCLHDLGRFREAAAAYDAVTPAIFTGEDAWRHEHLLEQRACCWLKAGEIERAHAEIVALLERWERNPHLAREAWGLDLAEAVRGPLGDLRESALGLGCRADEARARGEVHGFGLEARMFEDDQLD